MKRLLLAAAGLAAIFAAAAYAQTSQVGTSSPNALTVQGAAGGVAIPVTGSFSTGSNFAATFPTSGQASGCEFLSSPPTYSTSGQMQPCLVNSAGNLQTNVVNANANGQATMANSSPVVLPSDQLGAHAVSAAMPITLSSQYPTNANTATPTPETISATGTTTAFTATLAAGTGSQVTYICGAEIDAAATAGLAVAATITGTVTGTLNFVEGVSTLTNSGGGGRNVYNFNPCIPASAAATAIVIHAGAAGSGGISSISAWGYIL